MESRTNISDPVAFAESVRSGSRRALARALTFVENQAARSEELLDELYPHTGEAWRIGLTGPPGAGKSTLAGALIQRFVSDGRRVAYLGVDPSSPFSGGAVLGDRIRLDAQAADDVFIRSAASRGALGGLSAEAESLADVFDAAGFDIVVLESVGVGQAELDIVHAVDSVVVVLVPESGDEVQAMKAGLLEIADILCVNKADRQSSDALFSALRHAVAMRTETPRHPPAIVSSVGVEPDGDAALFEGLLEHREVLAASGRWDDLRGRRLRRRVREIVRARWTRSFWTPERTAILERAIDSMDERDRRPYSLASAIIADDGEAAGSAA